MLISEAGHVELVTEVFMEPGPKEVIAIGTIIPEDMVIEGILVENTTIGILDPVLMEVDHIIVMIGGNSRAGSPMMAS